METDSKKRFSWVVMLIPVVGLLAVAFYIAEPLIFPAPLPLEIQQELALTIEDAKAALRIKNYPRAAEIAGRLLLSKPTDADALLVAGEAALKMGEVAAALGYYQAVPRSAAAKYVVSRWSMANVYVHQGKLREAEANYREALAEDPQNIVANHGLGFLLGVEGRRWESIPHLLEPIRQGEILMEPLMLLGTIDHRSAEATQLIDLSRKVNPDDWLPALGPARIDLFEGAFDVAEKSLREILQHLPENMEAHALLGLLMAERPEEDTEKFRVWVEGLPNGAEKDPTIWYAKGVWAQNHGKPEQAARCYWETVRINPNHQRAHYRLARLLTSLGKQSDGEPFLRRAGLLENVIKVMAPLYDQRNQRPDPAHAPGGGIV